MNEELKIFITAQIDDLRRQLGAAQSEVQNFSSGSTKSMGKFGKAMGGIGKGVTIALSVVTGAIAAVSGAIVGISQATEEYRVNQAQLNAAFLQANFTAESAKEVYSELYKVIGDDDQATESAANIAMLTDNIEDAQKWAGLASGVLGTFHDTLQPEAFYEAANETLKLGEATGAFTQMLEQTGVMAVEDFNAALAQCNTEEEKRALLLSVSEQAMGKAGAAYNEGTKNIQAQREAQIQLNDAMAKLGEMATPVLTVLTTLAADLLAQFTPFISIIGEGLTAALNGSANAGALFSEGFGGLINSAIELLSQGLPLAIQVISALIPAIITTLAEQLPSLLQTVISSVVLLIDSINATLPELIPIIIDSIFMCADTILDNLDLLVDSGIFLAMSLAEGLIIAIPKILEKVPVIIDKLIAGIRRNAPKLFGSGGEVIGQLLMGIISAVPTLLSSIPTIINSIIQVFSFLIVDILVIGKDLIVGLWKGASSKLSLAISNFSSFCKNIISTIKNIFSNSALSDIGKNLIKGLWNGISDMTSWIKNKIKGFGSSVVDGLKDFFGIHSPSTLMKNQVGKNLALGVGEGFMSSIKDVNKEIEDSMQPLTQARSFSITGNINAPEALGFGTSAIKSINTDNKLDNVLSALTSNDKPIILQVDGKTLGQVVVNRINQTTKQTGAIPLIFA